MLKAKCQAYSIMSHKKNQKSHKIKDISVHELVIRYQITEFSGFKNNETWKYNIQTVLNVYGMQLILFLLLSFVYVKP